MPGKKSGKYIWHRMYVHPVTKNVQRRKQSELVEQSEYVVKKNIIFAMFVLVAGKPHTPFEIRKSRANNPPKLRGKMCEKSKERPEY